MDKASEDMGTAREPEEVTEKQKEEKRMNAATSRPSSVNEATMTERLEHRKEVIKRRKIRDARRKLVGRQADNSQLTPSKTATF